ncbi:hypothetical protein [Horticoccus sp. 23ND18S-11]|uniref:hypothetical protein n=1 Tax=Horticoccus sp. 23ND18S-11 TaxID=3391832 RepID=UPI0039C94979
MKLGAIPDPFSGEKLVEIQPRIAAFVDQSPRLGRLHYFPGRHLTAVALEREQAVRLQRLALRGRAVTSGVVNGLEVGASINLGQVSFTLSPGQALTASGVDIVVDRAIEVPYADLKLVDPVTQQVAAVPIGLMPNPPTAAFAAILVLQPGFADDADRPLAAQTETNGTDFTPCPRVPEDEVYFKTTSTDAARLVLYPLPWDEPAGTQWQNRVAWSVFNREAVGETMPWLDLGVPLAVVGFDAALAPAWIDRHAVVRPAGRPRQRVLIQPGFDARVWPARFDQFCAQLSALTDPVVASELARFLPPIGLLPKEYLSLARREATGAVPAGWLPTQRFFPGSYTIDVSVVPLEQLDSLIADCVRLQPFDLRRADAVRVLLPVSQQWFDPALLTIEVVDPEFDVHIARYRDTRGAWLAQRYDLANRRRVLELSAHGQATSAPLRPTDADPKRLETPEEPIGAPPGDATQFGVTRAGNAAAPTYSSDVAAGLRKTAAGFLKVFSKDDIEEFTSLFTACGLTRAQSVEAFAPAKPPEWLARIETDPTDKTLTEAERNELRRELLGYVKKQTEVQETEARKVGESTLEALIEYFNARANEADELVDAGFLKMRTDVFRLGNLLSNSALASKFTASASLANIIDRKPPKTDAVGVNAFASQLLANFAPSAVSTAVGTVAAAAPATAVLNPTAPLRATTLNATAIRSTGTSFVANEFVDNVGKTSVQIEGSKEALTSVNEKLLGANSPLTEKEKAAYTLLRDSANNLTSAAALTQLQAVADVAKFADNYVANFDLLSQKQIRAIPLDRLQPALAPTVRQEIHDGRLEIFERLTRLGISLGDLTTDFVDVPGTPVRPAAPVKVTRIRFQTLISRRRFDTLATLTQTSATTKEINDADESRHFSTGVAYADMALAALRAVETRIKDYRAFVDQARAALKQTIALVQQITTALAPVEVELDEARQDVAVALALKVEEQARLDVINQRRAKVLKDHVEFLVFHRPRAVALNVDVPLRRIEPALVGEPVIDCLRENPTPPADLAALRDAFRASPARWFKHAPRWIEKVDRWEQLRALLERASRTTLATLDQAPAISAGRYQQALGKVFQTRQTATLKYVAAAQTIQPASLVSLSGIDLRQQVERQLTLGHLIAAGPASLARAASEELDHLFVVATCLHENFSSVPGLVRLNWAERFGQFDQGGVDFRDLSRLPSWPAIDFTLRREMQVHADWLFGRIDATQAEAVDLINDLIRVALLLASHAPVDQLIVGHPIESETTPRPGGLLKLRVDPLKVRFGMEVFFKVSETQRLRAVVEDISSSHVSARFTEVPASTHGAITLTPASTFYFKNTTS